MAPENTNTVENTPQTSLIELSADPGNYQNYLLINRRGKCFAYTANDWTSFCKKYGNDNNLALSVTVDEWATITKHLSDSSNNSNLIETFNALCKRKPRKITFAAFGFYKIFPALALTGITDSNGNTKLNDHQNLNDLRMMRPHTIGTENSGFCSEYIKLKYDIYKDSTEAEYKHNHSLGAHVLNRYIFITEDGKCYVSRLPIECDTPKTEAELNTQIKAHPASDSHRETCSYYHYNVSDVLSNYLNKIGFDALKLPDGAQEKIWYELCASIEDSEDYAHSVFCDKNTSGVGAAQNHDTLFNTDRKYHLKYCYEVANKYDELRIKLFNALCKERKNRIVVFGLVPSCIGLQAHSHGTGILYGKESVIELANTYKYEP